MALEKGTWEGDPFTTDGKREELLIVQHPPLHLSLHDGHIVTLLLGQSTVKLFLSCLPTSFLLLQVFNKNVRQIEYFPVQNLHFQRRKE